MTVFGSLLFFQHIYDCHLICDSNNIGGVLTIKSLPKFRNDPIKLLIVVQNLTQNPQMNKKTKFLLGLVKEISSPLILTNFLILKSRESIATVTKIILCRRVKPPGVKPNNVLFILPS